MAYFDMSDETLMRRLVMKSISNMPDVQRKSVIAEYHQAGQLELVFTIGGVECDLVAFVQAMEEHCDNVRQNVRTEAVAIAKTMVADELQNVVNKLSVAVDDIVDGIEFKEN